MDTKEVINMFVILCIDFMMVLLYLIIGILFIRSNGRAIRYLTGHDLDENISNKSKELGIICGKQIMKWSLCFIIGFAIDLLWAGAGLILATILNTVLIFRSSDGRKPKIYNFDMILSREAFQWKWLFCA